MISFGVQRLDRQTRQVTVTVTGAPETTDHISRSVTSERMTVTLERLGGSPWKLASVAISGKRMDGGASQGQRDAIEFGKVSMRRAPAWASSHALTIVRDTNALEGLS